MKKNKISNSILNRMKDKVSEISHLKEQEVEIKEQYISKIDYKELEIDETLVDDLILWEEKALNSIKSIKKNLIDLGRVFKNANELLANQKNGTFRLWYEKLGFKKDFVYMCLKRYGFYMELEDKKIYEIPYKTIKEISKLKDISKEKLREIINAEKPTEVIKEINSVKPNLFLEKVKEREIDEIILQIE
ncbi:MAG: hypothetical protein MJH09_11915, partial [Cetobacterium sp.]|nr:hypothetical protein [Cetobacterium sp.]